LIVDKLQTVYLSVVLSDKIVIMLDLCANKIKIPYFPRFSCRLEYVRGAMTIKSAHLVGLLALLMGVASAFDSTLKRDFPGPYCALRNTCCTDRHDGCSLPISSEYRSMRSRKDRTKIPSKN